MARRRTVDLLPEIFRTSTNKQFLSATLDQLTQEPNLKRTQGFVGRRVGPGVNPADNYVTEPTETRAEYQLEPGVVFFAPDTNRARDAITYPGMLDALDLQGADTERQDRLWQSEFYSWDPFCDLDKFTNYSQYFWLPQGPDSVDVGSTVYPTTDAWEITRSQGAYQFSDEAGNNPIITLVRGGNYTFQVNQPGHGFWIQTNPGVDGRIPSTPNISSRDVLGVINNGEDLGTVTFNVPLKSAQDFYFGLTELAPVDLVTGLKFNQINNVYVDQFLSANPNGIDGITNLNGRTVIFTNQIINAQDGGWQITSQFDPLLPDNPPEIVTNGLIGSYDTTLFDQTTDITTQAQRYSVWQINYIPDNDGNFYIQLASIRTVPNLTKFRIRFGEQYASTQWFKNASGFFEQIPLLTAVLDTLYYQDGTDPAIFGRIQLVDQSENNPISIDDIIGAKNYISPNGVAFTNGLKVQFRGLTEPAEFQNLEYYVEGVGTGPGIDSRVGFIDGEAYFGAFHVHEGQKMTGASHTPDTFHQFIYDTIAESLANRGAGGPAGAPLPVEGVLNATLGNGIRLIPVSDFVTPETYTESRTTPFDSNGYDSTPFDETLNAPEVPDYITINRAAQDRNAWSRSNRWFHRDVIQATADYNNQIAVFNERARGKRPIIEFRANLRLFNFGTQGKQPVDIIDFSATDAFSDINGQTGFSTDGYTLLTGSRVIFAADIDPDVRNKIYQVEFIDPDGDPNSIPIINLTEAPLGQALINQTVVCLSGNTQQGLSFWFDGVNWIPSQQKTSVNQTPLFDVYDSQGHSLGDSAVYPSTTFAGSRLFGYAVGETQITDQVLGFALRFLNFNNVGDILFDNYLYTDTFLYVRDAVSVTEPVSTGFVRQYIDRVTFSDLIGWQPAAQQNRSRQVFRFVWDDEPLVLDVPIDETSVFAPLQIFLGTEFIDPTDYAYSIVGQSTVIDLSSPPAVGTIIEVQAISNRASAVAFYQVPLNLENNAINQDAAAFTLGSIRNHYQSIGQNLRNIQGPIDGANNTRDLGNILIYGDNIVQHSAPLSLAGTFLRQPQFEVVAAIEFNSREYQKFKARMMNLAAQGDFINSTPTQVLDDVIIQMGLGRNNVSPFYWSDMMPSGENYTSTVYVYSPISTSVFDTVQTYDYTSSNYKGMNVYLNGRILVRGYEYTVGIDSATIDISVPLAVGDQIEIREFSATYGSFVPNTPSKMGLYPAYRPEMYLDTTYLEPTLVIRGHDGSITVAFGDYRDDVLLEFETRIFNNIKIVSEIPLSEAEVIPGQFRTTDYTLAEITEILAPDFLSWVGWNKLDYTSQTYLAQDGFTWNYSQSANKLNRQPLLGAWRGIYNFFYDTTAPNTQPWEMLGFSQEPAWWSDYYGPAPYTSGNLVLWEDLAQGLVRDPAGEYILPQYARPDLLSVIPAGSEGELLPPIEVTTGNYDTTSFRRSWTFGDDGPVENVWRSSSAWPFAVMRLLALTKPAKFFGLFVDRDRYKFDANLDQYVWDGRYRLDSKQIAPLYGNGVSRASYIDWIIDYNRQLGANSTDLLETTLANTDMRLCWRVGGFTDKRYLKIFTERSTPNSLNTSLLLPDESYQILLYKNQPFNQSVFSSVVVQATDTGWQVYGYSTARPYFEILASRPNGNNIPITAGGTTVRIALDHSDNVVQVPYGYTFQTATGVCDFLYSYGLLLERQGFVFDTRENGYILNWLQMCQEFLYWSGQGWAPGTIINLNPGATSVSVTQPLSIVDSVNTLRPENLILNQNRQPLPAADLVIERVDNTFRATSLSSNTINYLNLRFTAYEHLVVLDNVSTFADLIYQPVTGLRQNRVLVSGWISGDWNGTVDAPGFVINEDNIVEWDPNRVYAKGEIVLFKNEYWSASRIIQPSQEFNYAEWIKSDYDDIQKGLLPNSANASDQLATAYSVYNANLETEVDLFSYGLIGFRPREYMQALNLDDVSQVNLYQQFLGTKGTRQAAELFSFADLGKETAQYDIFELWAMQKATYGATANRNYVELLLDQSLLRSDPSLIQIIQPDQSSEADQTVLLQNIWKSSQRLTSPDVLPTTVTPVTENSLPTAGYVNLDDVDYTVFDLENPVAVAASLDQEIQDLALGNTIWVAKSNPHDWNVYRVREVPGRILSVSDNLDGRALVEFSRQHNLRVNDYLIIKFFNVTIDGTYRVAAVPGLQSVLINLVFLGSQTEVTGSGVGFSLDTARVAQASDVVNLSYSRELSSGSRVWVDNNGQDLWTVLEKTNPFAPATVIEPEIQIENARFGTAVTQGFQNLAAMVGAPGVLPGGVVYSYVKTAGQAYSENIIIELLTTGTAGFGSSMDMGDQTWAVIGAPESLSNHGYALVIFNPPTSNAFVKHQILVIPQDEKITVADEFGYSVTVSNDERWMYIGAPGGNRVYAYGRIDVQQQSVEYVADGTTASFNYVDHVVVDTSAQLAVVVGNVLQTLNTDYVVNATSVVLLVTPTAGQTVAITRRSAATFTGDGSTLVFPLDNIYSATSVNSISVYVDNVIQRPKYDYDFGEGSSLDLTFVTAPASGTEIRVRATDYWQPVAEIIVPGLAADARFGHSVSTTTDGRQVLIGTPGSDSQEGKVYVFDRSVQAFQITNAATLSYTTVQSLSLPGAPINVKLNGEFLLNEQDNIGGTFSIAGNTVTLDTDIAVGDTLVIETNQFSLVQTLVDAEPFQGGQYGFTVDQCINDCSLYIGAPYDGAVLPEAGHVEYQLNQSRVYGITTSPVANPVLSPGDYLRVNDRFVVVPIVAAHNSALTYAVDDYVLLGGVSLYRARVPVPAGTAITDTDFWQATNWSAVMAQAIRDAAIPNVTVSLTQDLDYDADGITTEFSTGALYAAPAVDTYTTLVYVDNVLQSDPANYTYDPDTNTVTFVTAPLAPSKIRIIGARLVLSVTNFDAAPVLNKLRVMPGTGTVFDDLGILTYVYTQTIASPVPQSYSHFGTTVFVSDSTVDLVVGAPDGSAFNPCTFDNNTTIFDGRSTEFLDAVTQSGVVYTYDFLPAANASVNNPGQFVFGQQLYDSALSPLDQFGSAIDYTTGVLLVGAPGDDSGDSAANYGAMIEYVNATREPSWQAIRQQTPVVDVDLLNTVFMYDRFLGSSKQYFDFFDPLQGRVLGAVRQNLDYIGAIDPAAYNVGAVNNYGDAWTQARVGQIWWNTTNARFIDPNQDDIVYASRRWGQLFPGSTVEVFQWISSTVPPAQYTGPGTVRDINSYSVTSNIDAQGLFQTTYFFWVTGIRTVDRAARKTLSVDTITRYIEAPRSSGIAYIAPINASTIAIYNGLPYIQAEDTVLHVEYDQQRNQDAVHLEYQLIPQGRGDGFLTDSLYRKLQDSFCGVDIAGNLVPDPFLPPSELYGVQFRPRQSLFANRFLALENYLVAANRVMATLPLAETRRFPLLDSEEPEPAAGSGAWNKRVANDTELSYQDLAQVPVGYLYLVQSDATNDGLWTIYEVQAGTAPGSRTLALVRVQNYDTKRYWSYIDWYAPGYDPLTVIAAEVANFSDLETITVAPGSSVKVTANAQGKFEIYVFEDGVYTRVGLESGTIAISPEIWDYSIGRFGFDVEVFDAQYFDQEPVTETRRIIQAINQEIFIDDLAIERNRLLVLMFNFILSEQVAPLWLTKTSLIDVDHVIRNLQPFQIYRQDNQDFVLNYIQEVKPYHTQIREFNLIYQGNDVYDGTVTDFDVPAFWDSAQNLFISPVLDDNLDDPLSTTSSTPSTSPIWQTLPWNQWFQNYLLTIESVAVVDGGSGYTVPPQVIVTGEAETPAVLTARINSAGQVIAIDVVSPGEGYLTTALITLEGGNGTGARAVAVMGNQKIREFTTTLRYDRYQYQTTIVDWQPNVQYDNGTQVRYQDRVWSASSDDSTAVETATFDPEDWTLVDAATLSGVDRTMGFYAPTVNEPGLDLALLISGVDYPGVQVSGPNFNQNTGFDVGNYDINPFDNISIGPEGQPTYDPAILDAIYESEFTDPYLGTLPAPAYNGDPPTTGPANAITVAGGAFVDTYSSHAPEELVPGAIFDTLDFRVFTTPGGDWLGDGHGFALGQINYEYTSADADLSFADQVDMLVMVMVYNITNGVQLIEDQDYVVDWVAHTLRVISGANAGDVIAIQIYGLGGGNQIFREAYTGTQPNNTITVPVQTSLISEFAIFINGDPTDNFTFSASGNFATNIVFGQTLTVTDYVAVTALGAGSGSWSAPVQQNDIGDGSTLIFPLDNSLQGTNPVNIIVEVNGRRVRPAEGVEYIADGSSLQYYLPTRGGYDQSLIADNEVSVYLDGEPLTQGVDYQVDPDDGSTDRTITLTDLPDVGSQVLISVNHAAGYFISGTNLVFRSGSSILPLFGDVLTVTTFNDTREQNILTQVFVGPTTTGIQISEGYDTTLYDEATVSDTPGSFDFGTGSVIQTNEFDTGRDIVNASRIEVTLNGFYLFEGSGFVVEGTRVILLGTVIGPADVVAITSFTQSVVPNALAFRIFQDMRGTQGTYRITPDTTTVLAQSLAAQGDTIYVQDASRLSEPNLPQGIFGLITINGERIAYRNRDTVNNTISGLRRGTAGTGAAEHAAGTAVYDIGLGNLLPAEYQDRVVFDNFLADGTQTLFVAESIVITDLDSTELVEAVEVYVGGILQTSGYTVTGSDPVTIVFATAPDSGYQVSIRVRRSESWYRPGINTASDGVPLQETETLAARFIRGL
jgi:hypothetical protein